MAARSCIASTSTPAFAAAASAGRSVEVVLDWCRAGGITQLVLWSDTRFDRAHRLYEGMGFTRTGERELPNDPNDTREFGYERARLAGRGPRGRGGASVLTRGEARVSAAASSWRTAPAWPAGSAR